MVELDSTLSQCKERDWVFMVTVPMGTSRRAAQQQLHREHAMFVRSTAVEALEEQQSTPRCVASLAHFRDKCTTALREARAERDSNTARLDFPVRTETSEGVLTELIESEYRGLFDRINKELRAEQKRADEKTKDELKALEKLNATDPEKLLDGNIKNVVDRDIRHAGVMAEAAPQGNATATKVVEAIACPLAAARRKERAHSTNTKARRTARARARTRTRRTVPRTKKASKGQGKGKKPNKSSPCCGQRLTQGAPCSTACCAKGLLQTCKGQRTKKITSWSIVCITLEECTCIMHFENHRRQVLVLSTESRSVSEVECFWGGSLAGHLVSCQVSQVSCEEHRCSRPRMEARVQDFQQFAAKVRWK